MVLEVEKPKTQDAGRLGILVRAQSPLPRCALVLYSLEKKNTGITWQRDRDRGCSLQP